MDLVKLSFVALRAGVVLGAALLAMPLLRRASAATRRLVLVAAFASVVVLPIASALGPSLRVPHVVAPAPHVDVATSSGEEPIAEGAITHAASSAQPSVAPAKRPAPPIHRGVHASDVLLGIWAIGALLVALRVARGLWRTRRLVREATTINVLRANGRSVEVRASRAIETPAVTGVLRPVILVPLEAAQWTPERRLVVLMHELAHVERWDCLAQLVAHVACAMHWFDPLVWIAAKRLRLERELAADDRVLDRGVRPSSYAEHLLALARSDDDDEPAGALAMAHRSQIESRIVALLGEARHGALGRAGSAAICAVVGGLAFVVACASPDRGVPRPAAEPATIANAPRKQGVSKEEIARVVGADPKRVQLTLDASLQSIAEEETDRLTSDWSPSAATLVALDPSTGAILALTSRSDDATEEVAAQRAFVPGSAMKSFTVAAAIDAGVLREEDRFDCSPNAGMNDASDHAVLDVTHILAVSSNVGAAKIFERLGSEKLQTTLLALHFGDAGHVQFPSVASGALACLDGPQGPKVAIGAAATATPLQVAAAFAALADGGVYHAPSIVRRVLGVDGRATFELGTDGERVFSDDAATRTLRLLEAAVASDDSTAKAARIEGVPVAGKTGSAEVPHEEGKASDATYASFVGAAPADHPKLVVLVGAAVTRKNAWGGTVAAPVFARFVSRALAALK